MIEGQEVELVRPRVIHLVLRVISFHAERACPLAEINIEAAAEGDNVRSVRLEDVLIDVLAVARWPDCLAAYRLPGRTAGRAAHRSVGLSLTVGSKSSTTSAWLMLKTLLSTS